MERERKSLWSEAEVSWRKHRHVEATTERSELIPPCCVLAPTHDEREKPKRCWRCMRSEATTGRARWFSACGRWKKETKSLLIRFFLRGFKKDDKNCHTPRNHLRCIESRLDRRKISKSKIGFNCQLWFMFRVSFRMILWELAESETSLFAQRLNRLLTYQLTIKLVSRFFKFIFVSPRDRFACVSRSLSLDPTSNIDTCVSPFIRALWVRHVRWIMKLFFSCLCGRVLVNFTRENNISGKDYWTNRTQFPNRKIRLLVLVKKILSGKTSRFYATQHLYLERTTHFRRGWMGNNGTSGEHK